MDAVSEERGQAHFIVVLALAIGAIAVVGLRMAQDRIVRDALVQRAGEAAVEAAAGSLADAYAARPEAAPEIPFDPLALETARGAASELASINGAPGIEQLVVLCADGRIEARLVLAGHEHHAGFTAPECFRR